MRRNGSQTGSPRDLKCREGMAMVLVKACGKFCSYFWRCLNRHDGECLGYAEPEEDDEMEDRIDKMTY